MVPARLAKMLLAQHTSGRTFFPRTGGPCNSTGCDRPASTDSTFDSELVRDEAEDNSRETASGLPSAQSTTAGRAPPSAQIDRWRRWNAGVNAVGAKRNEKSRSGLCFALYDSPGTRRGQTRLWHSVGPMLGIHGGINVRFESASQSLSLVLVQSKGTYEGTHIPSKNRCLFISLILCSLAFGDLRNNYKYIVKRL
jgi:hypothetical protein